ncbi:major facilitator superfamily [Eremomyces bilateralis CBS 781.70]|uniref:Major facilitator superfamily n=1 Tax=Eremomyces bilateralis CBS 781.70 TaxID=1392243 RepID=A0A6G1GG94_9PEZI|nr:major facilitator superfamily [Eremomyces bilateralis CBS 781.70]KAF1817125.1 major facilitator superfamily [Eremomyces bilateralis CBS 781.70]
MESIDLGEKSRQDVSPGQSRSPTAHRKEIKEEAEDPALHRTSTGSSTSSLSSVAHQDVAVSRAATQTEGPLERSTTALSRIQTARSQHTETVGASIRARTRSRAKPMPPMGNGKPYPPPLPEREDYVVEFDGEDDPLHAQNWSMRKKLLTAGILGYTTFVAAFASSIFSAATPVISQKFEVGQTVAVLGVSLYVLGFATGPILWAPFSELYGRRMPLVIACFGFTVFQFAVAVGKDLQTVLICRFWGGFFGACPLTVVAAVFSDMFNNRSRGMAITVFSMTVFTGPLMAPFVGGFIVTSELGWRWTQYITGIIGSSCFILNLFFLHETYPPIILVNKASELRRTTKNWGIHAKQEEIEVDFRELVEKNFSRPLRMLISEPIVLLISVYMAFVYGLLYLFLTAYPLVFQGVHHMTPGIGGLPFFGMITGQLLAGLFMALRQPGYQKKLRANGGVGVPEWRLPEVIVGGIAFAGGLFWFHWTGYKASIHWMAPTASGLLTGFGIMCIFLQSLNYLVDAYLMFAASAIAANTFLRSLAGAGFPLFATQMYNGMGIQWAGTMLGCIAVALIPVPIWFYLRGGNIRQKSAYAPTFSKPLADEATSGESQA